MDVIKGFVISATSTSRLDAEMVFTAAARDAEDFEQAVWDGAPDGLNGCAFEMPVWAATPSECSAVASIVAAEAGLRAGYRYAMFLFVEDAFGREVDRLKLDMWGTGRII